ncbi:hypothetical protein [Bosea sp. LjRoot237]|uniref:hypothetical protein n=1 Tax=Bosea sp. LjRoot237 TaxID=3342292 RepID=UPI003ED0675C
MFNHERLYAVRRLIFDYLRSPSLRHLRDPHSVNGFAERIVKAIDREQSVWRKWEGAREDLIRAAALCWVPEDDLREFLNSLPGPRLTGTDVAQRLRAIHAEPNGAYPDEDLRKGCLALYAREIEEGTELPAIIGALQEYIETETERQRLARENAWRQRVQEERDALERRFLSGADCRWTHLSGSRDLYIRKNGRAYRLVLNKEKRWDLFRIEAATDTGAMVGTYGSRGDAGKALTKLAYEPEPRW